MRELLAGAGYLDTVDARVIPPGIAVNALHPSVVTAARLTRMVRDMEITAQSPVILFPAALQDGAGHDVLIDALRALENKTWVCLFVGVGVSERRYHYRLMQRIEAEGLERRLRIIEGTEDPATLYKLSDIVISTVNGNLAFDYACAESQAAGKVVLGANNGATAFQIDPGRPGRCLTPAMPIRWGWRWPGPRRWHRKSGPSWKTTPWFTPSRPSSAMRPPVRFSTSTMSYLRKEIRPFRRNVPRRFTRTP